MATVVGAIGTDARCSVHQCVLGIREGKEGWFHVVCPSSAACPDDGSLWANIVSFSLILLHFYSIFTPFLLHFCCFFYSNLPALVFRYVVIEILEVEKLI